MKRTLMAYKADEFVGYHDEHTLPVKSGQKVRIPKGTIIKTMHPSPGQNERIARLNQIVTVHHILTGCSVPLMNIDHDRWAQGILRNQGRLEDAMARYDREKVARSSEYHNGVVPLTNPMIVWAGSGGYWCECDINDVEII